MPYVNPYPQGVYLDNNATMPLLPSVKEALRAALLNDLANPSSIHRPGQKAKELLYHCKKELCEWLGTRDTEEWVFVSGATEAINSVLNSFAGQTVVHSSVDHSSVFESVQSWPKRLEIKVKSCGQFCEKSLSAAEAQIESLDRCLLNWQLVNNETGIAFDLSILEKLLKKFNTQNSFGDKNAQSTGKQKIFVLMDAAQAVGKLDESLLRRAMHMADYVVLSAHKLGAPTGIGALWMRDGLPYSPLIQGGSQEKRRRAGTHNTLGIAGFYAAIQDWRKNGSTYREKMLQLKTRALQKLSTIEGFTVHGTHHAGCLTNTLNFHFAGCVDESLIVALDLEGFYLSSGSACNSGSLKPSRVLSAMGVGDEDAVSSMRFCVGPQNTPEEIDLFCERIAHRVEHIRKSRSKWKELLPEMKDEMQKVQK